MEAVAKIKKILPNQCWVGTPTAFVPAWQINNISIMQASASTYEVRLYFGTGNSYLILFSSTNEEDAKRKLAFVVDTVSSPTSSRLTFVQGEDIKVY